MQFLSFQRLLCLSIGAATVAFSGAVLAGSVAGTAMYRERMALPPDAVFEAVLQDVSRADAPAIELGKAVLNPAGQTPFRFVIQYDDKAVDARHRYAVRATVRHGSRVLFTTDTYVPALGDTPLPLQLQMVAVKAPASAASAGSTARAPDSPLRNTYWKLVRLNGAEIEVTPNQREPHLVLVEKDSRLSGSGGCNGLLGGFESEGSALSFKGVASTMMACMGGMGQETQFLRTLGSVAAYRIASEKLEMLDASGTVVAEFQAVALR